MQVNFEFRASVGYLERPCLKGEGEGNGEEAVAAYWALR